MMHTSKNPIKIDSWVCHNCGSIENIPEGTKTKTTSILIKDHNYDWCPECVYAVKSFKKHVNLEDLKKTTKLDKDDEKKDDLTSPEHLQTLASRMEHLCKKDTLTKVGSDS